MFQEEAHLSSFRFICLAWLAERRGETTTNAAWRSHLLAVFPDLVEREGELLGAHASALSVSLKSLLSWQQHMSPLSDAIGLHGRETGTHKRTYRIRSILHSEFVLHIIVSTAYDSTVF